MERNQSQSYRTTARCGCGCDSQPVLTSPVCNEPEPVDCCCPCAAGMSAALQLLCNAQLAELTDFEQFAFLTDGFILGTSLNCPRGCQPTYDNLTGPLAGKFTRITPCTCENLEVEGTLYYPIPICECESCCANGIAFDTKEVALCALKAVAFSAVEGECCAQTEQNYQDLKSLLWQALHCGACNCPAPAAKATPCDDRNGGIERRRSISLTAGALAVANAAVLGTIGDILVLANDCDRRFYFVCDSAVEFIG